MFPSCYLTIQQCSFCRDLSFICSDDAAAQIQFFPSSWHPGSISLSRLPAFPLYLHRVLGSPTGRSPPGWPVLWGACLPAFAVNALRVRDSSALCGPRVLFTCKINEQSHDCRITPSFTRSNNLRNVSADNYGLENQTASRELHKIQQAVTQKYCAENVKRTALGIIKEITEKQSVWVDKQYYTV